MTVIGSLAVNIVAKTDQLQKGLGKAGKDVDRFDKRIGSNITTLSAWHGAITRAAGALGLGFMVRQTLVEVDALAKMSDRLGIATEALAGLQHAANLSGVTGFEKSLERLVRRTSDAARGTGEAKDAIKELGLSATTLNSLSPERQLGEIADALLTVENQADKVRLSYDLMGRDGVAMLNMLANGSAGLKEAADEAERLGLAISRQDAAKIEELNDSVTRLKASFSGLGREITSSFAEPLAKIADGLRENIRAANVLGKALGRSLTHTGQGSMLANMRHGFMQPFRQDALSRVQARTGVANAITPQRFGGFNVDPQQIFQKFTSAADALGGRMEKLRGETRSLWNECRLFPGKVRTDDLIHQLDGFRRFAMSLERTERAAQAPLHEQLGEQLKGFARFGKDLAFTPRHFTRGINFGETALQGTQAGYRAVHSGQRRQMMAEMEKLQRKEIKLSEVANDLLGAIRDKIQGAGEVFSIP